MAKLASRAAMYGDPGDFYFHYTTSEAAFDYILPDRQLRMSPYSLMRDPLESKDWLFGAAFFSEGLSPDAANAAYGQTVLALNSMKPRAKVLSMTIDATSYGAEAAIFGRGWARARMWEQYAENHAGVCLLYHRDRLDKTIRDQLNKWSPSVYWGEVRYTEGGLVTESGARTIFLDRVLQGGDVAELVERHIDDYHEALFFLKLKDWESEHEFRYLTVTDNEDYEYIDTRDTLAAVILGERFPESKRVKAIEAATRADAESLQILWENFRPLPVHL